MLVLYLNFGIKYDLNQSETKMAADLVSSLLELGTGSELQQTDTQAEFRQSQPQQLAMAGVAIAVISMILEFIALSGFAPTVSVLM